VVAAETLTILGGAIAGKHLPERFIQLTVPALFLRNSPPVWLRREGRASLDAAGV
jgi:hypothetical protein